MGKGPVEPPNLESMVLCNEQQLSHRPKFRTMHHSNLIPPEHLAIKELLANNQIIIKLGDKGSAVVIWDRLDYLREGYRQLSHPLFYKTLALNHMQSFGKKVSNTVEDLFQNGEIYQSVKDFLLEPVCRTPELYLLPQIHKKDRPVIGRSIISANNRSTERISQFIDHFLNPPTSELPLFVKDTTHFLKILEHLGALPPDCILASLDVTSLHTNIDHFTSLETFNQSRLGPDLRPSNTSLIHLLKLVLTLNNFQFNGQNYLQISGTAMGIRVAPSFAINTMGAFESK